MKKLIATVMLLFAIFINYVSSQDKMDLSFWTQAWYQHVENGKGDNGLNDFMVRRAYLSIKGQPTGYLGFFTHIAVDRFGQDGLNNPSMGFPIDRKVWVYEICQAKTAASMLTGYPHFSIFMPCKLAIYEDMGKTIISTMNMDMMLDAIAANPELHTEAKALFSKLKALMDSIS